MVKEIDSTPGTPKVPADLKILGTLAEEIIKGIKEVDAEADSKEKPEVDEIK